MKKILLLLFIMICLVSLLTGCKKDAANLAFNPENFIGEYRFLDRDTLFMTVTKYENGVFYCEREEETFTMKEIGENKFQPVHEQGKVYTFEYYGEKNRLRVTTEFTDQVRILKVIKK